MSVQSSAQPLVRESLLRRGTRSVGPAPGAISAGSTSTGKRSALNASRTFSRRAVLARLQENLQGAVLLDDDDLDEGSMTVKSRSGRGRARDSVSPQREMVRRQREEWTRNNDADSPYRRTSSRNSDYSYGDGDETMLSLYDERRADYGGMYDPRGHTYDPRGKITQTSLGRVVRRPTRARLPTTHRRGAAVTTTRPTRSTPASSRTSTPRQCQWNVRLLGTTRVTRGGTVLPIPGAHRTLAGRWIPAVRSMPAVRYRSIRGGTARRIRGGTQTWLLRGSTRPKRRQLVSLGDPSAFFTTRRRTRGRTRRVGRQLWALVPLSGSWDRPSSLRRRSSAVTPGRGRRPQRRSRAAREKRCACAARRAVTSGWTSTARTNVPSA